MSDSVSGQKVVLSEFGDYLQYERRYSPHTQEGYSRDVEQFSRFLEIQYGIPAFPDVSHQHIRSWAVSLLRQNTKALSIRRKLSALAHFYKWLRRKGLIDHNPLVKVQLPKVPDRLPKSLPEQVLRQVWDQQVLEESENPSYPRSRDGVMLALLYGSGLRRSELIQLLWKDIDFARGSMRIVGKGRKYRQVPLGTKVLDQLTRLREEARTTWEGGDDARVVLTDSGKPCYPKFVYNKVVSLLGAATTAEKKSPHVLRHSMATHLMDHGAELNAVKEILGHASLAATQVYTHNSVARIRQVYQQAHPAAGGGRGTRRTGKT